MAGVEPHHAPGTITSTDLCSHACLSQALLRLDIASRHAFRRAVVRASADRRHLGLDPVAGEVRPKCSVDEVNGEAIGEDVADVLSTCVCVVERRDELGIVAACSLESEKGNPLYVLISFRQRHTVVDHRVHRTLWKDGRLARRESLGDEACAVLLIHVGGCVAVNRDDVIRCARVVVRRQHGTGSKI